MAVASPLESKNQDTNGGKGKQGDKIKATSFGIDFGGVILQYDGSFLLDEKDNSYLEAKQQPKAFETIKLIINKYGKENIFIVSKAKAKMRKKISNWLKKHEFYHQTGFDINNLFFVSSFDEKLIVSNKLGLNIFIDDKFQNISRVVCANTIKKVVWFDHDTLQTLNQKNDKNNNNFKNNNSKNKQFFNPLTQNIKCKAQRNKIVIAKDWNAVQKILNKVPKYYPCQRV